MSKYQTNVKQGNYADIEREFVKKGFILEFFHVPTGKIVQFKAVITQYQDRYQSSWNHEEVYGRMDPISTFKGTKRTISLGWDVAAASVEEARENLQRATLLFSMLYPSYDATANSKSSTISASPLFKLSFVNLIRDYGVTPPTTESPSPKQSHFYGENVFNPEPQPQSIQAATSENQTSNKGTVSRSSGLVGSVDGFTFSPDLENGMFDPPGDGRLYPKLISLSCNFTVLHTHPLGWSDSGEFRNVNFPYGEPIREISENPEDTIESNAGGTDIQNSAKRNLITKLRGR